MGVVFALGFLFVLALFIGIICVIAGAVTLIVRHCLKKKTQKKYKIAQVAGVLLLTAGGVLVIPLAVIGAYIGIDTAQNMREQKLRNEYYSQYTQTDIIIEVDSDTINKNMVYVRNEFVFDNATYKRVYGLGVEYQDAFRGEAVANLNDGTSELTVYEYHHPANENLLCAGQKIYATYSQTADLIDYYNNCSFTYQCRVSTSGNSHYFDVEMNDLMFSRLINYLSYSQDDDEFNGSDLDFYITQTSDDGRLEREMNVMVDKDGTIAVRAISNPLSNVTRADDDYIGLHIVTDSQAHQYLSAIADTARDIKND